MITLLGLSLPGIIGGSVILETIFSIDGMGLLFFQSALSHDYPVIMGILIIGAFLTLIGNMIADLILLKLNPNYNGKWYNPFFKIRKVIENIKNYWRSSRD